MVKDQIVNTLQKLTGEKEINLEIPEREEFGDYTTSVALKNKKLNPEKIVKEINAQNLPFTAQAIGKFINLLLKPEVLIDNLIQIDSEKEKCGQGAVFKGQKIMFEFAHPNTHKAFHIGHLRNIATGEALCRLSEAMGAQVIRVNYQGDIGLHIAKALFGINLIGFGDPKEVKERAEYLGKAYAAGATKFEESEEAKQKIGEINQQIYSHSDPKLNDLYQKTRQWSLEYFESIYKRVATKFDRLYFESEVTESGKALALAALKKGILQKSEGAVIFPGKKYGLHDRVFVTGIGVPTYEAKDLGLAKLQFEEYHPDLLIHVVGPEQGAYFQVIFKVLELTQPETKGKEVHLPYGWVGLKEGKMSSRTGQVVLGEWLLDEVKEKIKEKYATQDEIAEQIALGAVKYSFLKCSLTQEIAFDIAESISLEGNSGPYLQYTFARTQSVLTKSKKVRKAAKGPLNQEETLVLRKLAQFPEIIAVAAKNYSPNLLCHYLFDLAQKFNAFYNQHRIIGAKNEPLRLDLTAATGQVLQNGLKLLGIPAPQKM